MTLQFFKKHWWNRYPKEHLGRKIIWLEEGEEMTPKEIVIRSGYVKSGGEAFRLIKGGGLTVWENGFVDIGKHGRFIMLIKC